MLAVVVLDQTGVQDLGRRQQDLTELLALLPEVQAQAGAPLHGEIKRLHTQLRLAQAAVLAFVGPLDQVPQDMTMVLGPGGLAVQAWARAGRASSAVENWHSILRPHLAVHRTLSPGLLALLAVWHNHRVFRRGVHKGSRPAPLSGLSDAPQIGSWR